MRIRTLSILVCLVALQLAPRFAAAQAVTLGSPLTAQPNVSIDCAARPAIVDVEGNFGLFDSGVADCTWRQAGVFGVPNDPRFSSVPGDGQITSVSVRSGPNPAPLRFVILRQLSTPGFGAEAQCCFFVRETAPVQPAPNSVTTFQTNIPVQRNTIDGFLAVDLFGVSAQTGTGTLPLHAPGRINAFDLTAIGSVNAGFFYPRVGAIPNDAGGGRREEALPGVEVLVQFTWCPAAAIGSGTPGCGGGGGGGGGGGVRPGPSLAGQNAAVRAGRALLDLLCNGDAACRGRLELLNPAVLGDASPAVRFVAPGAAAAATRPYGKRKYRIPAGGTATIKVPLSKAAKRSLRQSPAGLPVGVRLTPENGAPVTAVTTLVR